MKPGSVTFLGPRFAYVREGITEFSQMVNGEMRRFSVQDDHPEDFAECFLHAKEIEPAMRPPPEVVKLPFFDGRMSLDAYPVDGHPNVWILELDYKNGIVRNFALEKWQLRNYLQLTEGPLNVRFMVPGVTDEEAGDDSVAIED